MSAHVCVHGSLRAHGTARDDQAVHAGFLGGGIANGHAQSALALYFVPGSGLNHGNYGNPSITGQYELGASNVNSVQADDTLTRALRAALDDHGILPMYNPLVVWAGAPQLKFSPRIDDVTYAHDITKL